MEMTVERRREICEMIVEQQMIERGIPGGKQLKQDLGNAVKKLEELGHKVTLDELLTVYTYFVPKVLGKTFGMPYVSVQMSSQLSVATRKMEHDPL